jgi:hypothetical protein
MGEDGAAAAGIILGGAGDDGAVAGARATEGSFIAGAFAFSSATSGAARDGNDVGAMVGAADVGDAVPRSEWMLGGTLVGNLIFLLLVVAYKNTNTGIMYRISRLLVRGSYLPSY